MIRFVEIDPSITAHIVFLTFYDYQNEKVELTYRLKQNIIACSLRPHMYELKIMRIMTELINNKVIIPFNYIKGINHPTILLFEPSNELKLLLL
jgi:hypothetical protein